jgi:hypothetical protein
MVVGLHQFLLFWRAARSQHLFAFYSQICTVKFHSQICDAILPCEFDYEILHCDFDYEMLHCDFDYENVLCDFDYISSYCVSLTMNLWRAAQDRTDPARQKLERNLG